MKKAMNIKVVGLLLVLAAAMLLTGISCSSNSDQGSTDVPSIGGDTQTKPAETPTQTPGIAEGPIASEITGITAWINSPPLTFQGLRGKVVLVDFWTYTCVNCIRTFPYLRSWHEKYADAGLVILGVHTPEFEFEKDFDNVSEAAANHGIAWPIALDNDYDTWDAFDNRYWPAKYLIDKDGVIRYSHFGEGAYAETEEMIRGALMESGADLSGIDDSLPEEPGLDQAYLESSSQPTRELYAGTKRGYGDRVYGRGGFVFNEEYYKGRDIVQVYEDPGDYTNDLLYLEGSWLNGPESLKHGRETQNYEDYVMLRFTARTVNAVIKPEDGSSQPYKVRVTLDGEPLTSSNKGQDVVIEDDGGSFLIIDEPRLYGIVDAPSFGTFDLTLSSNSPQFDLYAFTFGYYESGM